jgi:hypothetical protein
MLLEKIKPEGTAGKGLWFYCMQKAGIVTKWIFKNLCYLARQSKKSQFGHSNNFACNEIN